MAATEPHLQNLTSEDIKRIRFSRVKRGGYDPQEVDSMLTRIADAISETTSEFAEDLHDPEGAAQRLLSAAQKTADTVLNDANQQAEQLVASAEAQADNMKRLVVEEARKMAEESQSNLNEALDTLNLEKSRLEERCAYLEGQLQAGKDQLLATIEEMKLTIEDSELSLDLADEGLVQSSSEDTVSSVGGEEDGSTIEHPLETTSEKDFGHNSKEVVSVAELMDSPPELTLVHDKESNEIWLQQAALEAEEELAEVEVSEEWDEGPPTEAIQVVDDGSVVSGDRFFEELSESNPHSSALGEVDDATDAAMYAFFETETE